MARDIKPTFCARIEHPKQHDMVPLLEAAVAAQNAEAEAARHAIGANGPPTDESSEIEQCIEPTRPWEQEEGESVTLLPELEPSYASLDRMFSSVFGPLWHGKVKGELGLGDERTIRRWRDGEGAPGQEEMGKARDHLLDVAIRALMAIGETDLASPLVALKAGRRSAAKKRALEIHSRNLAVAAAKKAAAAAREDARLARFEAWWKADCAKRARIATETLAHPRFFVSLAKPPKVFNPPSSA